MNNGMMFIESCRILLDHPKYVDIFVFLVFADTSPSKDYRCALQSYTLRYVKILVGSVF